VLLNLRHAGLPGANLIGARLMGGLGADALTKLPESLAQTGH